MKAGKKFIAGIAAAAVFLELTATPAFANCELENFKEEKLDEAADILKQAYEDGKITRGEFAEFFVEFCEYSKYVKDDREFAFDDIDDYHTAVMAEILYDKGIVLGRDENEFHPDQEITKEAVALAFSRKLNCVISDEEAIEYAIENGLLSEEPTSVMTDEYLLEVASNALDSNQLVKISRCDGEYLIIDHDKTLAEELQFKDQEIGE